MSLKEQSLEYRHTRLQNFLVNNSQDKVNESLDKVMNDNLNRLYHQRIYKSFDIEAIKKELINTIVQVDKKYRMNKILNNSNFLWGTSPLKSNIEKFNQNKNLYIAETGFLHSIVNSFVNTKQENTEFGLSMGFIVDDLSSYYDATRPSRMELVLNSDIEFSDKELDRAKHCMKKIIENKITKYNHQPIYEPKIGRDGVPKVLVIDQSFGDYSIIKGRADSSTFEMMLNTAIKENPSADIIIKTHPDSIGRFSVRPQCYYQNIKPHSNIYKLTVPINPISLINSSDKVYVCSSQFGFEALMAGKEVHTFGLPFYAGWGLTIDAQKCERRIRTRNLEEVFYTAYIIFSAYYNIETNTICEIEDVIDLLIKYRNLYFEQQAQKERSN